MHLYLHIPYCAAKCPYCDFNSIAGRDDEQPAYVDALLTEIRRLHRGPYATVFIGGGTPTSLDAGQLARLMAGVADHIHLTPDAEWTCEANPGSADAEKFAILAAHGVNRLSLGVQSTDNATLRFLGRVHDAEQAEIAIAAALTAVPRVSADLMFGLPDQDETAVARDLDLYRRHGLRHASVYHLAYEPGTEFHARRQRGELAEIASDRSRKLWKTVADGLAALGMTAYETSNFAQPGHESRHNLAYWQGRDYHAAGAGAVSTVGGLRLTREPHPGRYIDAIRNGGDATWKREDLSPADLLAEAWMLGLRLAEGVDPARLLTLGDRPDRWLPIAQPLIDLDLLQTRDGRLALTANGRLVQDEITAKLMP